MAMCHELPYLPLDRNIPIHVLQRRGAISFSSSSVSSISRPRLERRGGISYEKTDKTAIYVRTLGDVRVHNKKILLDKATSRLVSPFKSKVGNQCNQQPKAETSTQRLTPAQPARLTELPISDTSKISSLVDNRQPGPPKTVVDKGRMPANTTRSCSPCRSIKRRGRFRKVPGEPEYTYEQEAQVDCPYLGQVEVLLKRLGHWNFDIFHLERLSGGHSLQHVGMTVFTQHDLIRSFRLDRTKLLNTIVNFERGYYQNPYHNAMHAADVTQAMHCYLQEDRLCGALTPIETMAAIIAATAHDLDHPGVNQNYLISTGHHLAHLYKNSSVLENHHWRACISVLHDTGLLDHLSRDQWDVFHHWIQSLILATDIARQQEFLCQFQMRLENNDLDLKCADDRMLVVQIALKCADICNPCRTWNVAKQWALLVCQEFFNQGDRERDQGKPISQSCDRHKITAAKIQKGFLTFVVDPLFDVWQTFLSSELSHLMLETMKVHKAKWEAIIQEEEEEDSKHTLRRIIQPTKALSVTDRRTIASARKDMLSISSKSAMLNKDKSMLDYVSPNTQRRTKVDGQDPLISSADSKCNTLTRSQTDSTLPSWTINEGTQALGSPSKIRRKDEHDSANHYPHSSRYQRKEFPKVKPKPSSPRRQVSEDSFRLRLPRSPVMPAKQISFVDPWEKLCEDALTSHDDIVRLEGNNSSRLRYPNRQSWHIPDSSAQQTFSSSFNKLGRVRSEKTGLNNNIDAYIPNSRWPIGHGLNQNMSHSSSGELGNQPASPTSPGPSDPTSYLLTYSFSNPQSITRSSSRSENKRSGIPRRVGRTQSDLAHTHVSGRRTLSPTSTELRKQVLMGSPYIQRRMAEREYTRANTDIGGSLAGGLSPRLPTKAYPQRSESTDRSSHLYSVPPALGPLLEDFTSSQLESIARRNHLQDAALSPSDDGKESWDASSNPHR